MAKQPVTAHRPLLWLQLFDVVGVNAALVGGVQLRALTDPGLVWNDAYLMLLLVFNLAWFVATHLTGLYRQWSPAGPNRQFWKWAEVVTLHLLLVAMFIVVRKGYVYSRLALFYSYVFLGAGVLLLRLGARGKLARIFQRKGWVRRVVVVGYGKPVTELVDYLRQHPTVHGEFVGFFSDNETIPVEDLPYRLGGFDALQAYLQTHAVEGLYVFTPDLPVGGSERILALADQYLIPLHVVPDFRAFRYNHLQLQYHDELPVFYLRPHPLADSLNQALKRGFDLLFSAVFLLVVGIWLFPLLALLVKLSSPGPVLFVQTRAGRGGKPFQCLKLRTMRVHTEGFKQATAGDARITKIGAILRKTSLDELPQFINILLGEMSVVGPRPHVLSLDEQYGPLLERYKVRHVVKPGLTGLAQTRGHRGATPTTQTMDHRVRMDVFYVANWSLRLDLQIILNTALLVLKGDKQAY